MEILVKDCYTDIYEDSYEEGELDQVNTWEMRDCVKSFKNINELIKKLSGWGFSDKIKDYCFVDSGDDGTIVSDILINADGYVADKHEIELWEDGSITLYVARLSCRCEIVSPRPMTEDDAKEFGLEIY